jgi:predicted kinase
MATAHLLFGFLGSGKTTLAKELEGRHRALRFTPDEWMARLFSEDPDVAIFKEKEAAILDLLEPMWMRCLHLGVDVVLDYGFWSRAERDHVRKLVESAGAQCFSTVLNAPLRTPGGVFPHATGRTIEASTLPRLPSSF